MNVTIDGHVYVVQTQGDVFALLAALSLLHALERGKAA